MNSDDYTSNGDSGSSPYSDGSTQKQSKSRNPKYAYDRHKDKKPRRNKSAFILFSSDARAKIKAEKTDNPNSNEIMVRLADMWKNLSKEDSNYYKQKALEDKKRYHKELEEFWKANPLEVLENKTKRNHVKKPSSAYGLFLREMKDEIKKQQPGIKMAAVMKIIGEKWKNLDDNKKAIYQDRARKEQEISREKLGKHFAQNGFQPEDLFKKTKQRQQSFMRKKVKMDKVNPNGSTQTTTPMQIDNLQDSFNSQNFPELLPLGTFEEMTTDVTTQDQYLPGLPSFSELDQIQMPALQQDVQTTQKVIPAPQATEEPIIRVTSNLFPSDQSKETGESNLLFKLLNQPLMFKGDSKLDLLNFDSNPGGLGDSSLKLFGGSSFNAFLSTKDYETEQSKQEAPKLSRADILNNAIMRALDKDGLEIQDDIQQNRNMSVGSLNYLM